MQHRDRDKDPDAYKISAALAPDTRLADIGLTQAVLVWTNQAGLVQIQASLIRCEDARQINMQLAELTVQ
jgi:hypothetical protein